jgi:predicted O-methyltransferase YrrM
MITERLRDQIKDMLSLKRRPIIEGWTTQEKAEVLAGLIIDHKPQLLVEVGVFGGRSMFAQAMALRENGMGIIWGIDPWTLESALEGDIGEENAKWWTENVNLEDIYVGFLRGVLDFQLTKQTRWIREKGSLVAKIFQDRSIDVLHLDANHSETSSCREAESWHRKVKPGGFLIADDTDWETVGKSLKIIRSAGFKAVIENKGYTVFQKPNGTA